MEKIFWGRMAEVPGPLHFAAMREHLRRMALWADHYGLAEYWPVFKVSLVPGLRSNPRYVAHWMGLLQTAHLSPLMKAITYEFIHWRGIQDPGVLPSHLPDAFAAYQYFVEIGGWVAKDHSGALNFQLGAMPMAPMSYYLEHPPWMDALTQTTILAAPLPD